MLNEKQIMAKIAESCNSQTLKSHYTLKVNSKALQFRYSEEQIYNVNVKIEKPYLTRSYLYLLAWHLFLNLDIFILEICTLDFKLWLWLQAPSAIYLHTILAQYCICSLFRASSGPALLEQSTRRHTRQPARRWENISNQAENIWICVVISVRGQNY